MVSPTKNPDMQAQLTRTKTIWEELSIEPMKANPPIDFNTDPNGELVPQEPQSTFVHDSSGLYGLIMIPGREPRFVGRQEGKGAEVKYSIKAYAPETQVEDSSNSHLSQPKLALSSKEVMVWNGVAKIVPSRTASSVGRTSKRIASSISKGAKKSTKAASSALKATARSTVVDPARMVSKVSARTASSVGRTSKRIASSISKGAKKSTKAASSALKATARSTVVDPARMVSKVSARTASSVGRTSKRIASSISKGAKKSTKAASSALKATARSTVVDPARMVSTSAISLVKRFAKIFRRA